jgi:hypothetical protein
MYEITSPISVPCFFEQEVAPSSSAETENVAAGTILDSDAYPIESIPEPIIADISPGFGAAWLQGDDFNHSGLFAQCYPSQ